jgi:hypothetical protein
MWVKLVIFWEVEIRYLLIIMVIKVKAYDEIMI